MVTLGTIEANTVEKIFVEFVDSLSSTGSLHGSADSTENLLTAILPEDQVKSIMEEISGPAGRTMWDKLGNVNEAVFANYLKTNTRSTSPWSCQRSGRTTPRVSSPNYLKVSPWRW